jgi:hypothetical protein
MIPPRLEVPDLEKLLQDLSTVSVLPMDRALSNDFRVSELRRGRGVLHDQKVGFATLIESDGVLYWTEGISTVGAVRRRAYGSQSVGLPGRPLTTVKFEKLGVNEVAAQLEKLDDNFTQKRFLRFL